MRLVVINESTSEISDVLQEYGQYKIRYRCDVCSQFKNFVSDYLNDLLDSDLICSDCRKQKRSNS